jgi:hypothetical protein
MRQLFSNNASAVLNAELTAVATTLVLNSGQGSEFPAPVAGQYFLATITQFSSETTWEVVRVTARTGDTLTIERAQESTTAQLWPIGSKCEMRVTAGMLAAMANSGSAAIVVSGPTSVVANSGAAYTILAKDAFFAYAASAAAGSAVLAGDTITYTAPATAGTDILTIDVDNYSYWRDLSIAITADPNYIATPVATPAAFGDAFEGGFYTGMIWNELVQSATSATIGTGSMTFTTADTTGAPLSYIGQQLEVRSRANPANKMIGTLASATPTTQTITITSVTGAGTFADWSIMARYRLIVAPKASGQTTGLRYKNDTTASPAETNTLSEGYKATLAMVAAGGHPAATYCDGLTIAGKSDWYLPARDELELAWRNLKPTADNNIILTDRTNSATDYRTYGAADDSANTQGLNTNSDPAGAAYTLTAPAQVAAGKNFRTGESEAFDYTASYRGYWTASEQGTSSAWFIYFDTDSPDGPGGAYGAGKTSYNFLTVRAFRRSII